MEEIFNTFFLELLVHILWINYPLEENSGVSM